MTVYQLEKNKHPRELFLHTDKGYKIEIGDLVSVGHNAVVHGARIGNNVIVGMGAILLNGAKIGITLSLEQVR